jgi:short-subunit dehydrogenase
MGTAVVTGASSGIGAEYARELAARGHDLVLVARRADRLTDLADEVPTRAEVLQADLADAGDLTEVAARVAADDVDLLVNNAGMSGYGPFVEQHQDVLRRVMELNEVAPTALTRAALPGMVGRGRGAVINVASLLAFASAQPAGQLPYRATYAATKAHLVVLTRTLAGELDGTGVRVQVCCPGYTESEFHDSFGAGPTSDPAREGMPPQDVVQASLTALDEGEVVCVPGLHDPTLVTAFADAEHALRSGSGTEIAERYRR